MSNKVKPRLPSGFKDYSPQEMIQKSKLTAKITEIFSMFGFDPLDTSTVQYKEVLHGVNEEGDVKESGMEYFQTQRSRSKQDETNIALRYDLTISLARYVAPRLNSLPRPFKRWQVGKVYRGEKAQAGRFCEFTQCDADIMFVNDVKADAEIVALMYHVLNSIGLPDFVINLNNRKISDGLPEFIGFPKEDLWQVLRIVDKMKKIGPDQVRHQLAGNLPEDERSLDEKPIELADPQINKLMALISISGDNEFKIESALNIMKGNAIAEEGLQELKDILSYTKSMGCDTSKINIDFGMVRGLSYYTGPVFEANITGTVPNPNFDKTDVDKDGNPKQKDEIDLASFGTIFAGGRFDGLVSRFVDANVAGTGASVGIDRLLAAMLLIRDGQLPKTDVQVQIIVFDNVEFEQYLKIATMLRNEGIKTLVYASEDMSFKAQMAFAAKQEIPIVIIAGKELENEQVSLKNMKTGKQSLISFKYLHTAIEHHLTDN